MCAHSHSIGEGEGEGSTFDASTRSVDTGVDGILPSFSMSYMNTVYGFSGALISPFAVSGRDTGESSSVLKIFSNASGTEFQLVNPTAQPRASDPLAKVHSTEI